MAVTTIHDAITRFGINVVDHLDRSLEIPILAGLQCQGDVAIIPMRPPTGTGLTLAAVPAQGLAVVRAENNSAHTHTLLGDGEIFFDQAVPTATSLSLGTLYVPPGATAYLAHPEHAYAGIAPGTYEFRRQREQADELRLIAD